MGCSGAYHSFAEELTRHYVKKKVAGAEVLPLLEYMITHRSWWDTIDMIAQHAVATLFKRVPELIDPTVEKWMTSGNFWLQRTCILFQNRYKQGTNAELLFQLCDELAEKYDNRPLFIEDDLRDIDQIKQAAATASCSSVSLSRDRMLLRV